MEPTITTRHLIARAKLNGILDAVEEQLEGLNEDMREARQATNNCAIETAALMCDEMSDDADFVQRMLVDAARLGDKLTPENEQTDQRAKTKGKQKGRVKKEEH